MHRTMNVVPFRAAETFEQHGIDWTKPAATERERALREAFLTYESSCGPEGLASLILLELVSRRQGAVAEDLQYAADLRRDHAVDETATASERCARARSIARVRARCSMAVT